jgi:hypothetical protein
VVRVRALIVVGLIGLIGLIACGPGLKRLDTREVGRAALTRASGDAGALEGLMEGSVAVGGLWFGDAECQREFAAGFVAKARLSAFARCLATLPLRPSPREDALGDVVVMTYGSYELEARIVNEATGPRLTWIGFASRRDDKDTAPTLNPVAFEALRLTGDRNGPLDPAVAGELELDADPDSKAAFTWIKVCLDEAGAVREAYPFVTTTTKASKAFVAAARAWTFRPFTIHGRPTPACSMVRMAYPPDRAPPIESLPMPPPPSRGKKEPVVFSNAAKLLEGRRIAGSKFLSPDDDTKREVQKLAEPKLVGTFRICLDENGLPESIMPMRSTGFAAYDRLIMAGMSAWRYAPYMIDDQPVPVCTTVTYVYSQR